MTANKKMRLRGPNVTAGSQEARRVATEILEVLAGVITPAEAAAALDMCMPKYYTLEVRALNAMIEACEPKQKGRVQTPASKMEALEKELKELKQAHARQQAILRATRRTMGLAPKIEHKHAADGKRHRTVKPSPRALKVVQLLRKPVEPAAAAESAPAITTGP